MPDLNSKVTLQQKSLKLQLEAINPQKAGVHPLLIQRSSQANFASTELERRQIIQLLQAACCAPSSHNSQPWYFIVVTNGAGREEIGVEVRHCRPLLRLHHEYPDRDIDLDVWRVDTFTGEPQALDGQALRWCSLADLPRAQLLPADVPVITALRLPERMTALRGDGHEVLACEEFAGGGLPPRQPSGERLRGALCASLRQARTAAAGGAEFIVFTLPQPPVELAAACRLLNLPVFASGLELSAAQAAGAVGISQL